MLVKENVRLDKYGMAVSLACAIHCTLLPLLISFAPMLGLNILTNPFAEFLLICLSLLIAGFSLLKSYPMHKKRLPLLMAIAGFSCILTGHCRAVGCEMYLLGLGGLLIAGAHLLNWRGNRGCTAAACHKLKI